MILKINKTMSYADGQRGVPTFFNVDGVDRADFREYVAERVVKDGEITVMVTLDDETMAPLWDLRHNGIVLVDSGGKEYFNIAEAVLTVTKNGKTETQVYYFDTVAYLMNDAGETLERLLPGKR